MGNAEHTESPDASRPRACVDGAWFDGIHMFGYAAFAAIGYLATRPINLVDSAYRPPPVWQLAVPYAAILTLLGLSPAEIRETYPHRRSTD